MTRKTIPFPAFPVRELSEPFPQAKQPSTSTVTGQIRPKTLSAELASPMAIASPKNKEELLRQFKFNPEINTRLEAFMKAEPGLVQFIKELPREQLERKFLLRKMHDEQRRRGYDAKVKAWLESPEQAELVQSLKATVRPEIKPDKQAQMLVNQAKNYIRNTGIKTS